MKTYNKKGFTLVELIVVITILAILGTIAFLSLQGYSSSARNTKRTSDLNNIKLKVEIEVSGGKNLFSFIDITNGTGSMLNWSKVQIAGFTGSTELSGQYLAGDINFESLGIDEKDFLDPLTLSSYKIGATTKRRGSYEIAATIEDDGGGMDSLIFGNWEKRYAGVNTDYPARGTRLKSSFENKYYLSGAMVETGLQLGDKVEIGGSTNNYIIRKMKFDTLYLDKDIITDGGTIYLNSDEMLHLISSENSKNSTIKIGEGEKYLPYKFN